MSREVIMPALGMAQNTGLIVGWLKKPGDAVRVGDALMEVETDKAVMEVEAQADGFLTDVRAFAGDAVPVGDVIARISETPAELGTAPVSHVENNSLGANKAVVAPSLAAETNTRSRSSAALVPFMRVEPKSNSHDAAKRFNAFAEQERSETGQRILASPKARRLAAERGLDLSRLVAAGIPQPYHASDLDRIHAIAGPAPVLPLESSQGSRHLTARIRSEGFGKFCEWMRAETGTTPNPTAVMASMAAAALRQDTSDKAMIVAAEAFGRRYLYIDPDRLGLGGGKSAESEDSPTLILRDLRGTAVTAIRMGGEAAPVLTVTRDGLDILVTLECVPGQMSPGAAVDLISGFVGRLAEPLRHLL